MKNKLKKIGVTLSITLNVLVLIMIIWLLFGGFFKLFVYPSYERNLNQFETLNVQSGDVVFLGDSLIAEGKWDELFPDSNVRNRGLVGDITTGVMDRLDQITKGQPEQVFLMIGINDLSMGVSEKDVASNTVKIIDKIHADSPDTKIFVQSILPNKKIFQKKIESINAKLEKEVNGKATWINLYPLFLDEEKVSMNDSLSNDDAHLLGQGYIVWRDAIADFVDKNK